MLRRRGDGHGSKVFRHYFMEVSLSYNNTHIRSFVERFRRLMSIEILLIGVLLNIRVSH